MDPQALTGYIVGVLAEALKHDSPAINDDQNAMKDKLTDLRGVCFDILDRCCAEIEGFDKARLAVYNIIETASEGRVEGDW